MRITESQLRRIIRQEVRRLREGAFDHDMMLAGQGAEFGDVPAGVDQAYVEEEWKAWVRKNRPSAAIRGMAKEKFFDQASHDPDFPGRHLPPDFWKYS